jgi:hypothetical protein
MLASLALCFLSDDIERVLELAVGQEYCSLERKTPARNGDSLPNFSMTKELLRQSHKPLRIVILYRRSARTVASASGHIDTKQAQLR